MDKMIIQNIYNDIMELADKKNQEKLWLSRSQSNISSYSELMCRLFDDNDFDDFLKTYALKIGLSTKLLKELFDLQSKLNNYSGENNLSKILNDPKWNEIIQQAQLVVKLWKKEKHKFIFD
jgi:hypothetical protein